MRFLLDANLSPALAEGHIGPATMPCTSATTISTQRRIERSSHARAWQEEEGPFSADTDFDSALARTAGASLSVDHVPSGIRTQGGAAARSALDNLPDPRGAEPQTKGCVVVIEATRVRVRSLPILGWPE